MENHYFWYKCEPPTPPIVMRRSLSGVHEKWQNGTWQPTTMITDWMFGHADDVDEITEGEAQMLAPEAFV